MSTRVPAAGGAARWLGHAASMTGALPERSISPAAKATVVADTAACGGQGQAAPLITSSPRGSGRAGRPWCSRSLKMNMKTTLKMST